jgi:hypothetical protein
LSIGTATHSTDSGQAPRRGYTRQYDFCIANFGFKRLSASDLSQTPA